MIPYKMVISFDAFIISLEAYYLKLLYFDSYYLTTLKDKSEVGMIDDRIQDNTAMNDA